MQSPYQPMQRTPKPPWESPQHGAAQVTAVLESPTPITETLGLGGGGSELGCSPAGTTTELNGQKPQKSWAGTTPQSKLVPGPPTSHWHPAFPPLGAHWLSGTQTPVLFAKRGQISQGCWAVGGGTPHRVWVFSISRALLA